MPQIGNKFVKFEEQKSDQYSESTVEKERGKSCKDDFLIRKIRKVQIT